MGYGGYAPGANSRMEGPRSDLEQALRALPLDKANESLEIMEKLTRNVVSCPGDEKFRKIKLTNKKINDTITAVPGAVPVLREMGWKDSSSDGEPVLVLPAGARLEFQETVVKLIEAKDFYKKENEKERRQRHRDEVSAEDPEKQKLRLQLEQDKKERDAAAANSAPTRASQAQKLGDGPNIMRAGDIGIGKSKGG
jgi:hypothetical protein